MTVSINVAPITAVDAFGNQLNIGDIVLYQSDPDYVVAKVVGFTLQKHGYFAGLTKVQLSAFKSTCARFPGGPSKIVTVYASNCVKSIPTS